MLPFGQRERDEKESECLPLPGLVAPRVSGGATSMCWKCSACHRLVWPRRHPAAWRGHDAKRPAHGDLHGLAVQILWLLSQRWRPSSVGASLSCIFRFWWHQGLADGALRCLAAAVSCCLHWPCSRLFLAACVFLPNSPYACARK